MSYTAAVLTISDKGARGERADTSGPAIRRILEENGWTVVHTAILPDEEAQIRTALMDCADQRQINLVLTTGGTGFSPRDVTPEATLAVVERETRGIPEAMRAESMRITPRGCLSRSAAGIRKRTLIVNLPGSEKAAKENLLAVLGAIGHGVEMLLSSGSADCAAAAAKEPPPSLDEWLREAKAGPEAGKIGMYLAHNGVVRETARSTVRDHAEAPQVRKMRFRYDKEKAAAAIEETRQMEGIYFVRAWLGEGELAVGDDIMRVLVGGDIRPRVIEALQFLVGKLKSKCVTEEELYE